MAKYKVFYIPYIPDSFKEFSVIVEANNEDEAYWAAFRKLDGDFCSIDSIVKL